MRQLNAEPPIAADLPVGGDVESTGIAYIAILNLDRYGMCCRTCACLGNDLN